MTGVLFDLYHVLLTVDCSNKISPERAMNSKAADLFSTWAGAQVEPDLGHPVLGMGSN